ncbi:hypothetical protein ACTJKC_12795 [Pedobacter sp. 22226]
MLRHEATLSDEKDASYLSMIEVQKDCSEWRGCSSRRVQNPSFPDYFTI